MFTFNELHRGRLRCVCRLVRPPLRHCLTVWVVPLRVQVNCQLRNRVITISSSSQTATTQHWAMPQAVPQQIKTIDSAATSLPFNRPVLLQLLVLLQSPFAVSLMLSEILLILIWNLFDWLQLKWNHSAFITPQTGTKAKQQQSMLQVLATRDSVSIISKKRTKF